MKTFLCMKIEVSCNLLLTQPGLLKMNCFKIAIAALLAFTGSTHTPVNHVGPKDPMSSTSTGWADHFKAPCHAPQSGCTRTIA